MAHVYPWKVILTVSILGAFGIVALLMGQLEMAALAGGALAGYLGKVNGAD